MTSDFIPDGNNLMPTDEELADVMIYDEIIETERHAAELEAEEHEIRWATISRPVYMD